jgi:hypothetical protein
MTETPVRHASAIAATAHPYHRHHQLPETGMVIANSAKNTAGHPHERAGLQWREDAEQACADVR